MFVAATIASKIVPAQEDFVCMRCRFGHSVLQMCVRQDGLVPLQNTICPARRMKLELPKFQFNSCAVYYAPGGSSISSILYMQKIQWKGLDQIPRLHCSNLKRQKICERIPWNTSASRWMARASAFRRTKLSGRARRPASQSTSTVSRICTMVGKQKKMTGKVRMPYLHEVTRPSPRLSVPRSELRNDVRTVSSRDMVGVV